jgi:energy-converting hydrogenase Eha subunit B
MSRKLIGCFLLFVGISLIAAPGYSDALGLLVMGFAVWLVVKK